MSSLFFWNQWSRTERLTYIVSFVSFIVSLFLFSIVWMRGLGNVVRWDVLSELNELPITLHAFTDGLLDYAVSGKAYAVSEQFVVSAMQVQPGVATAFLTGIGVAFVLLLSAVTRFDRIRYLVSMAVIILGLAFFRWEMLEVPGLSGNYLFLLLAFLFGSLSYYFHAFRSDYSIPVRLGAFGSLTILIALLLGRLSPVAYPALAIVGYGMPVLLAFSAGFVFFIATEIVAGLVWLTSAGRPDGNSPQVSPRRTLGLTNFMFISLLYLVNLTLIWLKNTRSIDWDVLAISPFLIYLISVTIGVWGFRRLTEQQAVVSFRDGGAYLYAGFALLTTLTMAYAFATANDPLVEAFEDIIVYTHLAMGVFFVGYVLINFRAIYKQNLPVYRVLYKPKRLELSLFRVAGVFGVLVLLASGGLITLRQSTAGYYNGLGDLYVVSNEPNSANAFYQLALEQEFQNHKSNYSLASLALAQNNQTAAAFFFQQALLKQPSPQDYAGLSQTYLQTDLFFEAVKTLQRGIRAFPTSGELQNNLGFLYARTSVADSAYYYLKSATGNAKRDDVPMANLLAFYARNPKILLADSSLATNLTESTYESYQANALALRLVSRTDTTSPAQPDWLTSGEANKGLSVGRFASLYNYTLANQRPDTILNATLQRRSVDPVNQDFTDDLLLARAVAEYNRHNHAAAFSLMSQLAEGDQRSGSAYRSITGLWLLEQGLYRKAAETFAQNDDTTSIYYRAVVLTKANDPVLAQSLWETAAKKDPAVAALKQVLYDERKPETDLEKAFYVSYRPDDPNRGRYWETIRDVNLKTVAGASLVDEYLATRQPFYAQMIVSQMGDPKQLNAFARSTENLSTLRVVVSKNKLAAADSMSRAFFLPQHEANRLFLLGQVYAQNRQPAKAQQLYRQALQRSPLTAWIVAPAAELLRQQKQPNRAYDLVLTALPFNEDNAELLKTYVTLCLDLHLRDYADEGLARLQTVTPPADYQAFVGAYQEKLASIEKDRQKFID
ncbi:tetratricopeptide repeat protein [Spirosoma arcticum]